MKLSTALKISGVCLFALAAEAIIAYLIFSNYAFSLAETGSYNMPEAYTTGPMATVAKVFYGVFGLTVAVAVGAPVVSLLSKVFQQRSKTQ
jgi:hypothetical protein